MPQLGKRVVRLVALQSQLYFETLLIALLFIQAVFAVALDPIHSSLTASCTGVVIVVETRIPALVGSIAPAVGEAAVNGANIPEVGLQLSFLSIWVSILVLPDVA